MQDGVSSRESLVVAARFDRDKIIQFLLTAGDAINQEAVITAVENANKKILKMLLAAGNHVSHDALMAALREDSFWMMEVLLAAKTYIGPRTLNQLLRTAVKCRSPGCMKLLLKRGAHVNAAIDPDPCKFH